MKITQEQLRKIIIEEYGKMRMIPVEMEEVPEGEREEGSMARNQLARLLQVSEMLHGMIHDDDDLEEWVESKITKAHDYLTTVLDYMKGEELSEEQMTDKEKEFAALAPPKDKITYADKIAGATTDEAKMTKSQMKKREKIVKGMKSSKGDFEKRYPGRGEEVMYATATKQAMKK